MHTGYALIRRTAWRPLLVAMTALAVILGPAVALGQDVALDGIWFIQETGPGIGPNPYYASVHQNGNVVVAVLLSLDGEWIYVVGTRAGSTMQGTIHFPDGENAGTFSVTVTSPTTLTGQSGFGGLTTPLNGTKVF